MQSLPACQTAWKSISVCLCVCVFSLLIKWPAGLSRSAPAIGNLSWSDYFIRVVRSPLRARLCVCVHLCGCVLCVCVGLWRKSFIRVTGMNDSTLRSFKGLFLQTAVDTSALRRWAMMGLQWKPPNSKSFLSVHLCLTPAVVGCPSKPQELNFVFVEN